MVKSNPSSLSKQHRGEEARRRLIEAGIEAFGTDGYEAASTRSIVEKAGVNLGAIPYYFKNKQGLYHAVAEHISCHLDSPEIDTAITRIDQKAKNSNLSKQQALLLMHDLFDALITTILSSEQPDIWIKFVFRELMEPSSVFEILNEKIVLKTISPCSALVSKLIDKPTDDPECTVRAFSLVGQVLIFRIIRPVALKGLDWKHYNSERVELIREVVHQQIDEIFKV